MAMFTYESDILASKCHGDNLPDGHLHLADVKKELIDGVKGNYPQLTEYE